MSLQGADGLARRLHALSDSMHGYPADWGQDYVAAARPQIPVLTGKTRESVGVSESSEDHVEITGSAVAQMIDGGTRSHEITPHGSRLRFQDRGRTVFSRKVDHPGTRARPFIERAAEEATDRNPMAPRVIDAWNRAD